MEDKTFWVKLVFEIPAKDMADVILKMSPRLEGTELIKVKIWELASDEEKD